MSRYPFSANAYERAEEFPRDVSDSELVECPVCRREFCPEDLLYLEVSDETMCEECYWEREEA